MTHGDRSWKQTTSVKNKLDETTWNASLGHSNTPDLRLLIRGMEFANTPFVTSNNCLKDVFLQSMANKK